MEYVEKETRPAASRRNRTLTIEAEPDEISDATETPSTRRRVSVLTILGSIVAVLVVAGLIFTSIELVSKDSQDSLRSGALKAANTYGVYLSSYNYADLNGPTAPWTEVDQHATTKFKKDFDTTKANLQTLVTDYKATATGKVLAAGLNSISSSRAVVLLFIDQKVTNTAEKPGTATQPLRVELVLVHHGGKWLIDDLKVPS